MNVLSRTTADKGKPIARRGRKAHPDDDFFFTVTQVIPAAPQPPAPNLGLIVHQGIGQESESGDVGLSFEVSNTGDYAQSCVAPLQFANTGNLQNA